MRRLSNENAVFYESEDTAFLHFLNICLGLWHSRIRRITHHTAPSSLLRHDCASLKWQGFTTASLRFFSIYVVLCRAIFVNTKVKLSQKFINSNRLFDNLFSPPTRRGFSREIVYKNIAIIAIQHSKTYFISTFSDFSHTVEWNSLKSVFQISLYILAQTPRVEVTITIHYGKNRHTVY